jgi:Ca-activated chloride channel family protein
VKRLALALLLTLPAAAQTQPAASIEERTPAPVFRVATRLVNVFVSASDGNGAPIAPLEQKDFEVFDDGQPQRIDVFERQSETPLSLVMALDTSGSMVKDSRLVREAARQFVRDVIRPQDEMQVVQFSENVDELVPFTNEAKRIDDGLRNLRVGESTNLYDAVYLAAQSLGARPADGQGRRKRVIVVISDGDDSHMGMTYAKALEAAQRDEAMVFSIIVVPIPSDAGRNTGGEHALIQLSTDTGGRYYYVQSPEELKRAFAHLSDDLRAQYLLAYYAPKHKGGIGLHSIEVRLADPVKRDIDLLRYRSAYYGE